MTNGAASHAVAAAGALPLPAPAAPVSDEVSWFGGASVFAASPTEPAPVVAPKEEPEANGRFPDYSALVGDDGRALVEAFGADAKVTPMEAILANMVSEESGVKAPNDAGAAQAPTSEASPARPGPTNLTEASSEQLEAEWAAAFAAPGGKPEPPPAAEPAPAEAAPGDIRFSEDDLKVLDTLERVGTGLEPSLDPMNVKPAQMVASLIRLLIRKGVIQEMEFLDELGRK